MKTELHWAILKVFADEVRPDNREWVAPSNENDSPLLIGLDERADLIHDYLIHTLPEFPEYEKAMAEEDAGRCTKKTDKVIDGFIQVYESAFDEVMLEVQEYVSDLALTALANH